MGCFWGVERLFWQTPGVWVTLAGYAGGHLPSPTYEQVCTDTTGHAEAVHLVFDPQRISYQDLLSLFWENHDPTQGMRQGADKGSQYRSVIFFMHEDQKKQAEFSRQAYQQALHAAGHSMPVTTEIVPANLFYPAEDYHQQYLEKNPEGYCGLGGTGVRCTTGTPGL